MTAESFETLVTPEMEQEKGVWGDVRISPPIAESDIRKWAIASYWPEKPPRLFWDAEYAKGTRWGGIIAPQDFNPFAWPIDRPPTPSMAERSKPGNRAMNGGQVDTFGVPMRPGDVITSRTRLKEWNERTTKLGMTLFTFTETEWRNQRDEVVKTRIFTLIKF